MSQWLDMQPGGSAWMGDWGTGTGTTNDATSNTLPTVNTKDSSNNTMLILTGVGVVLAAMMVFKGRK